MFNHFLSHFGVLMVIFQLSCTPDFDEAWLLKDLRILAIRSDTPEILLEQAALEASNPEFPQVSISALVVDPSAPSAPVTWKFWACTSEEITCAKASLRRLIHEGQTSLNEIQTEFSLDQSIFKAGLAVDPYRNHALTEGNGLAIMIELEVSRAEQTARAFTRIVYGRRYDSKQNPNANPRSPALEGLPSAIAAAGQTLEITPVAYEADQENYILKSITGGQEAFQEYLSYAFYVTAGRISEAVTGGKPSNFVTKKSVTDLSTKWFLEPKENEVFPPSAVLYMVVRDDRAGVAWTKTDLEVMK